MKQRVLVLDDDPQIGRTIARIAETAGISARHVEDAEAFFRLLEAWRPTHLVLDLVLPGMDGVEVLAHLAAHDCRARIIVSSGLGQRVLEAAGRTAAERGLDIAGVLPKPFSPSQLRGLLWPEASPAPRPEAGSAVATEAERTLAVTAEDLERALAHDELELVYQPKVACASGALVGFEALVRWMHPQRGVIMPGRLVPPAGVHGMMGALTERVLDLALDWFHGYLQAAPADASGDADAVCLAMNIAVEPLQDPRFVERILERCRAADLAPARLIFELSETAAMDEPVASLGLLTRLRLHGFQLCIDDFGTGYSSMLQLVRLPFSEIKVDKSFVINAVDSKEARTVARSIVDLGHSLGLLVTAEGVEDAGTMAYLNTIGCDRAQGYFVGRPMAGDDVSRWVEARAATVPQSS